MENCLFCKITKKEIPSEIIDEDDRFIAMLDINPVNKGHTLIIPKKHYLNIKDMEEPELSEYMKWAKKIATKLTKILGCEGFNILINNEKAAGQAIFHSHMHIIPRYKDDGVPAWQHGAYEENEIKKYGEKLRKP